MFGKPVKEYLALQKWWLVALVIMGLLRIALSVGGTPSPAVKWWTSTNLLGYAAAVYYGVAGYRRGFLFKQLYPLVLFYPTHRLLLALSPTLRMPVREE